MEDKLGVAVTVPLLSAALIGLGKAAAYLMGRDDEQEKAATARTEALFAQTSNIIGLLNTELARQKVELEDLHTKVGVLTTQLQARDASIAALSTEVASLRAELAQREDTIRTLQAEMRTLRERRAGVDALALEAECNLLKAEVKALKAEVARLERAAARHSKRVSDETNGQERG